MGLVGTISTYMVLVLVHIRCTFALVIFKVILGSFGEFAIFRNEIGENILSGHKS